MTNLKKHNKLTIPFYFIATDYYISPMLEETTPNAIFIAHKDSTFTYLNRGIPKKLIVPSGIPVSRAWRHATARGLSFSWGRRTARRRR